MRVLQSENLPAAITSYSFTSTLWKGVVPPRIELFGWFVLVGRVNTKDRLSRLGVIHHSDNVCALCNKEIESVQHLFLMCDIAWKVWCCWLQSVGRKWAIPGTIRGLFESWTGLHTSKQEQKRGLIGFFAVIWNIWLERNDRIFNNKVAGVDLIQQRTLLSYKEWADSNPSGC
ncbi:uncharacterized protein [Arachis hypogaea]|uniref:uncharacterized protein n=1 Tax=Arachis hypogaea TaxID=3818 RepID=UPI003B21DBD5